MHHQMFQECCPIMQIFNNAKELEPTASPLNLSLEAMRAEVWPEAFRMHGQESPLNPACMIFF